MTQAAGQASGKQSRGLNRVLRPNVKFPSLFVYLPPSFTGWLHCSEWRHVEKAKKEGRGEGGGRKRRMKKLAGAILTSLTAGRKCFAASRGGANKESWPQMQHKHGACGVCFCPAMSACTITWKSSRVNDPNILFHYFL